MEGIGRFAYETLSRITVQHPEHTFIFIFDRDFDESFIFSPNVIPVVAGPPAKHPFLFYIWFEYTVNRLLKKYKADIFVSPDGYLSLSSNVKSLPVIHDLNFEHYPKDLPFLMGKYYRYFFPEFARKATRIATVSRFSKMDIVSKYNISEDKIDIVYNGVSELFKPADDFLVESVRSKYSGGKPYFLYVGSIHPRKNISNLLKAFDLFKNKTKADVKLIIAGEKYYWTGKMQKTLSEMDFNRDVIFAGRLDDEDLASVISAALALTYVSNFEGFGLPIIEAMYCDVPVITSNQSSMPEIAGNAAVLVNPFSVDSIANAMFGIYKYPHLSKELIEKGRIRRMAFSWQNTADKLWVSICNVAG